MQGGENPLLAGRSQAGVRSCVCDEILSPETTRGQGVKQHKTGDVTTIVLNDRVGIEMIYCAPGEFVMGSPTDEEGRSKVVDETQHHVRLTKGFWLGKFPVTQGQWNCVMDVNMSRFTGDDRLPVDTVSWDACNRFIWNIADSVLHQLGAEARLPTEAEWEYACRAGTTTPYSWGYSLNGDMANCDGRYVQCGTKKKGVFLNRTTQVGSYPPNAWGFYDMHGNVWEWCNDWHSLYSAEAVTDPIGPASGKGHIMRGGSWIHLPGQCRSAFRLWGYSGQAYYFCGFRLCCSATV